MQLTLGITLGDPLGIGAEVSQKALAKLGNSGNYRVFGSSQFLKDFPQEQRHAVGEDNEVWTPETAGRASVAYLDAAMEAYRKGEIHGLVTAPIAKKHVKMAGFAFPGHTEYLAAQTDTKKFVMMMAGPKLRVTLVTIHEPLRKVSDLLNQQKIIDTIEVTYRALQRDFGIERPRLAVCGLNPHAGEAGLLGREEIEIIGPAILAAQSQGYPVAGPQVPDAIFHEAYHGDKWDAVIVMYHDQGLIPFKMMHFQDGVNVTLGLPIVRTSPDHGTAFDIAGQNKADSSSMEAAIDLAWKMLRSRGQGVDS